MTIRSQRRGGAKHGGSHRVSAFTSVPDAECRPVRALLLEAINILRKPLRGRAKRDAVALLRAALPGAGRDTKLEEDTP